MLRNQHPTLSPLPRFVLLWALILFAPALCVAQVYSVLTFDAKGDGRDPSLADAAQLAYRYDKPQDMLWFRIALYGRPNVQSFGVSIAFATGGDEIPKTS